MSSPGGEAETIAPTVIPSDQAPVHEVVTVDDDVNLHRLPLVRHHKMDGGPYIDMTIVMHDPQGGHYNAAFLRTQVKGPRKMGIHMSPQHSWRITQKVRAGGRATPVVIVVSHHPAFHIGALNGSPFGDDNYKRDRQHRGAMLRVTPSKTWGDEFMVPADADMVIEGEIPRTSWKWKAPFGEFPVPTALSDCAGSSM